MVIVEGVSFLPGKHPGDVTAHPCSRHSGSERTPRVALGRRARGPGTPSAAGTGARALVGAGVATHPEHQAGSGTRITTSGGPGLPPAHRGLCSLRLVPDTENAHEKQAGASRPLGHTEGRPPSSDDGRQCPEV